MPVSFIISFAIWIAPLIAPEIRYETVRREKLRYLAIGFITKGIYYEPQVARLALEIKVACLMPSASQK